MPDTKENFVWKFHRLGGLDQVTLRTADELCHLAQLDPKLWVALSCPASGLEFNARALGLIDADNDGRIRIPEVVAAVEWTCARLNDPTSIIDPPEALPLSAIKADTEDGRRLLASAEAVLASLGKPEAQELGQDEVTEAAATASQNLFNGDGILPAHEKLEADVRQFILDGLSVVGGAADASGQPGLNKELADAFIKLLEEWRDWKLRVCDASSPLGDDTPEGGELMNRLRDKIDDYFLRCDLAASIP